MYKDILKLQQETEIRLERRLLSGKYTWDRPYICVNPYGNSPLSAIMLFRTHIPSKVFISNMDEDFSQHISDYESDSSNFHVIGIAGLKPGWNNLNMQLKAGNRKYNRICRIYAKLKNRFLGQFFIDGSLPTPFIELYDKFHLIVDANGTPRWLYNTLSLVNVSCSLNNEHRIIATGGYHGRPAYLYEIDWIGKIHKVYYVPNGAHHYIGQLKNGNLLVCSNSGGIFGLEDVIIELSSSTGEVVNTINLLKLIPHPKKTRLYINKKIKNDFFHINSCCMDRKEEYLYISCRTQNAVICISYENQCVEWILSENRDWPPDLASKLLKPDGEDFSFFYGQHSIKIVSEQDDYQDIALFDNGVLRENNDGSLDEDCSRGVVYRVYKKSMTVHQLFEYGRQFKEAFFSEKRGNVDVLEETMVVVSSSIRNIDPLNGVHDLAVLKVADMMQNKEMGQVRHVYDITKKQVYQMHLLAPKKWIDGYTLKNDVLDFSKRNFFFKMSEEEYLHMARGSGKGIINIDFIKFGQEFMKIRGNARLIGESPSKTEKFLILKGITTCYVMKIPIECTPDEKNLSMGLVGCTFFNMQRIFLGELPNDYFSVIIGLRCVSLSAVVDTGEHIDRCPT